MIPLLWVHTKQKYPLNTILKPILEKDNFTARHSKNINSNSDLIFFNIFNHTQLVPITILSHELIVLKIGK